MSLPKKIVVRPCAKCGRRSGQRRYKAATGSWHGSPYCRECHNEYTKARFKKRREDLTRTCAKCDKTFHPTYHQSYYTSMRYCSSACHHADTRIYRDRSEWQREKKRRLRWNNHMRGLTGSGKPYQRGPYESQVARIVPPLRVLKEMAS